MLTKTRRKAGFCFYTLSTPCIIEVVITLCLIESMKYFNRSFFRFVVGFLIILAVSLFLIVATSSYASGVERIVFVTEAQAIKPNVVSEPIKVEFQDISHNPQSFGQTSKLVLKSSSPTGTFVSESGNPISATINSNWTSRTFYYKDSSEGTFIISAGVEGTSLEAEQKISVTSGAVLGASTEVSSGSVSASTNKSFSVAGSIYEPSNSDLQIDIVGESSLPLGSVGYFRAAIKKNTGKGKVDLNWSFGDGYVGDGVSTEHTYKYAGKYAVVLRARSGEARSMSRFDVEVLKPDLRVAETPEYIEIYNDSSKEIDLFRWKLTQGYLSFIFQPYTILLPRSSLKVERGLLNLKSSRYYELALFDANDHLIISQPAVGEGLAKNVAMSLEKVNLPTAVNQETETESASMSASGQEQLRREGSEQKGVVLYESTSRGDFFSRAWQFFKSVVD